MTDKEEFQAISKIKEILPHLDFLQVAAVNWGIKPAMAQTNIGSYNREFKEKLDRLYEILDEVGLELAVSNFKIVVNPSKKISIPMDLDDPRPGSIVVGISSSKKRALKAVAFYRWKLDRSEYSTKFGRLMGYPECCLEFGEKLLDDNDPDNEFGFGNPELESLKRSKRFDWRLNVFTRPLTGHIPCHLNCSKSKAYVDEFLSRLWEVDPEFAEKRENLLKEPASLFWKLVDKILLFGDFNKKDRGYLESSISYNKVAERINDHYYKEDKIRKNKLREIHNDLTKGEKLVMKRDVFEIYDGQDQLIKQVKKDNDYLPVLVRPDNSS